MGRNRFERVILREIQMVEPLLNKTNVESALSKDSYVKLLQKETTCSCIFYVKCMGSHEEVEVKQSLLVGGRA